MRLSNNVKESIHIYHKNGSTYCKYVIDKEMKKSNISYNKKIILHTVYDMHGYQEITCHVISDMKTYFTGKARFVANGSKTEAPVALTYSIVVSRDSVQLAFLIAALNYLDVMICGIGNAYLNVPF